MVAIAAGIVFWFLLNRTVFGFNLRATGMSESAAVASGVNVKRMTLYAMLMSGALAGLIGMPNLFGESYNFGSTIQSGIGSPASRWLCSGATTRRGGLRCADLRLPQRAGQPAGHPGRHLARHHPHHPGRRRALGRHRLRGRTPLPAALEQGAVADALAAAGTTEEGPADGRAPHRATRRPAQEPEDRRHADLVYVSHRPRRCLSLLARHHRCRGHHLRGHLARRVDPAMPIALAGLAVCGPSGPAWSTSASRA